MATLPDWSGESCVVVASGPSAAEVDLGITRGRARHIAINTTIRLCPWADVLYAADVHWWKRHREHVEAFGGLKVSPANLDRVDPDAVRIGYTYEGTGFSDRPATVAHMGNSGAQAVNLALLLGARRIALVGFDLRSTRGVHWHGSHPHGLTNPSEALLARWARNLDAAAPSAAGFGAQVVNTSQTSALTAYPLMTWQEAAEWLTQ